MKAPVVREEVSQFHSEQILVDLHVDVIIQQRLFGYDIRKAHGPWMRRQPFVRHADIPRMLEGGYTTPVFGIHYWPWESKNGWSEVRKQLDYMEEVIELDERVVLARSAKDIRAAHEEGRLAVMAGLEGTHLLGGELEHVAEAAQRGCVYLTLAHFSKNAAATPSMGRGRNEVDGITSFGKELIKELNEARIFVDVAHVNGPGVLEACALSTAPVIASHSCARGVHPTPRGLEDEGMKAIAQTGGVIGLIFSPDFLCGKFNASLDVLIAQARYFADKIGPEFLAIGTDFDGWIPTIPNDIRDCRDMSYVTQKLLDGGFSKPEVSGILGENFLRSFELLRPTSS